MSNLHPKNQPHVQMARQQDLRNQMNELSTTVRTLVDVAMQLQGILAQHDIPEVQDLLEHIRQQAQDAVIHLVNVHEALDQYLVPLQGGE